MGKRSALGFTLMGFIAGAVLFTAASLVLAWTGPASAPPNGNVSAPINVGTVDQIKNAGLGINALAVFGDAILSGAARYLNFGSTAGSGGYGIRDNGGVMEYRDSGGTWKAISSLGSSSSNTNFTISSDTQNANLYVIAGSPATAGTYTVTINAGVTVGSASTGSASLSTGVWPAGSTVLLINNGNIYGSSGAGGAGGTPGSGTTYPPAPGYGGVGGAGGSAISLGYNVTINNTNGKIFGGGGGGGGGDGGGGGGVGYWGGSGGTGQGSASPSGPTGGTPGTQYYSGSGGAGGAWASGGGGGGGAYVTGQPGGAAGKAILLNGKTITWLGGNDATHVKGAVQ